MIDARRPTYGVAALGDDRVTLVSHERDDAEAFARGMASRGVTVDVVQVVLVSRLQARKEPS